MSATVQGAPTPVVVPTNAEFLALAGKVATLQADLSRLTDQHNALVAEVVTDEARIKLLEAPVVISPPVPPPIPSPLPPPAVGAFHEPAGLSVLDTTDWTSDVGLWWRNYITADKPMTTLVVPDGPLGVPSPVLQIGYLAGHVGGGGTELGRWLTPKVTELYWRYPVRVNPMWQGHSSGINKMVYCYDSPSSAFSALWYIMFGSGQSPLGLYLVYDSGVEVGYEAAKFQALFSRGAWHWVEIYQRQGQPGRAQVWVDGVLAFDVAVVTQTSPISLLVISGIWGGVGDAKAHDDWMQFGPLYVSGR